MMLGAASLICVPISDGTDGYGTLTLARQAGSPRFTVADLGLAEELGQHLAVAIRVDRMFRHRSQVAETLQASLLPARLPANVPGLEFASAYIGATQSQEISGDFYDVFKSPDGWAIAIGDVCGKGQDAAAMTAAARHAIRALAHVHDLPRRRARRRERCAARRGLRRAVRHGQARLPAGSGPRRAGAAGRRGPSGPCRGAGRRAGRDPGRRRASARAVRRRRAEPRRPGAVSGRPALLLHRRGDRGAQRGRSSSSRTSSPTRSPRST